MKIDDNGVIREMTEEECATVAAEAAATPIDRAAEIAELRARLDILEQEG